MDIVAPCVYSGPGRVAYETKVNESLPAEPRSLINAYAGSLNPRRN